MDNVNWDGALAVMLGDGKNVSQGAIWDLAGKQYATSEGFKVSESEYSALIAGFKDQSQLLANGVVVAGAKYQLIQKDADVIVGRKADAAVVVKKTTKLVYIAVTKGDDQDAKVQIDKCASLVENGY